MAGCEVLVSDGATAVSYPLHYASGYKALLVRYVRTAKHGFEWDGAPAAVLDVPKPTAEKRTVSLLARARIRAALSAKASKSSKGTLMPIASCSTRHVAGNTVCGHVQPAAGPVEMQVS